MATSGSPVPEQKSLSSVLVAWLLCSWRGVEAAGTRFPHTASPAAAHRAVNGGMEAVSSHSRL